MHTERVRERGANKKEKKKEERGKEQKDWSVVEIGKEGGKKESRYHARSEKHKKDRRKKNYTNLCK